MNSFDKHPRMEMPSQYDGEMIHVSKRLYDGILKKAIITDVHPVGGIGGKVVIHYKSKKGSNRGVLELYDLGPVPIKKEQTQHGN